ncbi:MAG: prenyltransferase/squalene oxidase repeat-containing protein [Anaerolineaceae bacterium]
MWREYFRTDPLPVLLTACDPGLVFLIERDLLEQEREDITNIWSCKPAERILNSQTPNGSWRYKGNRPGEEFGENYELVETWKMLRLLIGKYSFNREHPAISRAAEFIFSCQSAEGDIRGFLSNQYAPYYTGALLELLIKAGYSSDERVIHGLDWLLSMRQEDGGWIIPLNMFKLSYYYEVAFKAPIPPNRDLPSSHMTTGMVLRAFCAHPRYREKAAVLQAGELLANRLFAKDTFTFRQAVDYWFKLQYPYWWTNLLSAMDSLAALNYKAYDPRIRVGLEWFRENQHFSGTWTNSYEGKDPDADGWISYAVCRMAKSFLN